MKEKLEEKMRALAEEAHGAAETTPPIRRCAEPPSWPLPAESDAPPVLLLRRWRTRPADSGGYFLERVQYSLVQPVEATHPLNGNSLADCRGYIATFASLGDLWEEPDGRIFAVLLPAAT